MEAAKLSRLWTKFSGESTRVSDYASNLYVTCPLAKWTHKKQQDTSRGMSIKIDKFGPSLVHCWACKHSSTLPRLFHTLSLHDNKDYSEFIKLSRELELVDIGALVDTMPVMEETDAGFASVFNENELKEFVHKYDYKLGFDNDFIRKWEICFDLYRKRIVFPVRNRSSELIGAVGRTVVDNDFKYYNYWHFEKRHAMYGDHLIDSYEVVVAEGCKDTLALDMAGVPVLGLLGSNPSASQVKRLSEFSLVTLFLDDDQAGFKGTTQLLKALGGKVNCRVVNYANTSYSDPYEVYINEGKQALRNLVNTATVIEFI